MSRPEFCTICCSKTIASFDCCLLSQVTQLTYTTERHPFDQQSPDLITFIQMLTDFNSNTESRNGKQLMPLDISPNCLNYSDFSN